MNYGYNLPYKTVRIFCRIIMRLNYRKMIYLNRENLPTGDPVIYAPNHRNAVIDGLLLVQKDTKPIVFLARSDIFKNKFVAKLLDFFHVIPVYRIRDGKDNLSKNDEIFKLAGDILKHRFPICLFPEAVHSDKQQLLPLKKGIPRIALPTEEKQNFSLGMKIVPVTIYYTDIHGFRSDVYVNFCKPIDVAAYREQYLRNANESFNTLRNDMQTEMQREMPNITNDSYYMFYKYCIDFNAKEIAQAKHPGKKDGLLLAVKDIVDRLDYMFDHEHAKFILVANDLGRAQSTLHVYGIDTTDGIRTPKSALYLLTSCLLLLVGLPIAMFGFVNTLIPVVLYAYIRKKVTDTQYISSLRVATALFTIPLFYMIQFLIVLISTHDILYALMYVLLTAAAFFIGCTWYEKFKRTIRDLRVYRYKKHYLRDWESICKFTDWKEWF